jgi:hypothetical protein
MGDLMGMFGLGGADGAGGGLGGLAALADSGLLPPSVKRLLSVLQFALKVRAAVLRTLKVLGPLRPYLFALVLLLPALRFVWKRVLAGMLGSGAGLPLEGGHAAVLTASVPIAVASLELVRRTDLDIVQAARARVADFVLLVATVLCLRRNPTP